MSLPQTEPTELDVAELSSDRIETFIMSLDLPFPRYVEKSEFPTSLNEVWVLTFDPDPALAPAPATEPDGSTKLFLRAALPHTSPSLVATEVAVINYLTTNTTIPVPVVLKYDNTTNNLLRRHYTLLVKARGIRTDQIWDVISPLRERRLVEQMGGFLNQLNALEWHGIGSIQQAANGQFVLGKYQDPLCWTSNDLLSNVRPGLSSQVTLQTLEIGGPFENFAKFSAAMNNHCAYVIENHENCLWLRDLAPRLRALSEFLRNDHAKVNELELNNVKHVLCHPDLNFKRTMFDHTTNKITAILNWQYAMVCPAWMWNLTGQFLWNGRDYDDWRDDQARMTRIFRNLCRKDGITVLQDAKLNRHQNNLRLI